MLLVVTSVEYGEKEAKNGKMFSGYYLRGATASGGALIQEYFISDLAIKKNSSLTLVKALVEKDKVNIDVDKDGKVTWLCAQLAQKTYSNTTQDSIERQNALTNAVNLVCSSLAHDKDFLYRTADNNQEGLAGVAKVIAGRLLNFHKEITDAQ